MKIRPVSDVVVIFFMLCLSSGAMANFTFNSNFGARSAALGGVHATGFGSVWDVVSNPAALTKVERNTIHFGAGVHLLSGSFESNDFAETVDSDTSINVFPDVGVVYDLGSRLVSFGVLLSTTEQFNISYPDHGIQRSQLSEMNFYAASLDAAIGFIPRRDIAFGIKLGYQFSLWKWKRIENPFFPEAMGVTEYDIHWKYDLTDSADLNVSGGFLWTPTYRFELGVTYRPSLAFHYSGDLFVDLPEELGSAHFKRSLKHIRMEIPQSATIGFHWIASERIDVYFDIGWTQLSAVDSIAFEVKKPHEPQVPQKVILPFDFDDEWKVDIGCEVLATNFLKLRFGGFWTSEVNDGKTETLFYPSGEKLGFTSGFGMEFSHSALDFAAGYVVMSDHNIGNDSFQFPLNGSLKMDDFFLRIGMRWFFR